MGTISPTVTWKNASSRIARIEAMLKASPSDTALGSQSNAPSIRPEMTGSPTAPSTRLEVVTPSCTAEMNLAGLLSRASTRRARRLPWSASSWMRVRRTATSPNSAATKKAFSASTASTATSW